MQVDGSGKILLHIEKNKQTKYRSSLKDWVVLTHWLAYQLKDNGGFENLSGSVWRLN